MPPKAFGWHLPTPPLGQPNEGLKLVDVATVGDWSGPAGMQEVYRRATVEDIEATLEAGDPGRATGGSTRPPFRFTRPRIRPHSGRPPGQHLW